MSDYKRLTKRDADGNLWTKCKDNEAKMKKKIIVLALALMLVCLAIFSGCNMQIIDLNYKFTNAYVKIGEEWVDLEIKTWLDYEGEQIQITLHDGTVFIVHSANCILYNGELPIQGGNND